MVLLKVENLRIDAGQTPLVKGVSFSVKKGETVALVGESGSGKTLSALAVMGLLAPELSVEAGTLEFDGLDLLRLPPVARRKLRGSAMAMVFQEPATALNPVLTCGAQVDEVFVIHTQLGRAERKKRVLELFKKVKLPDPERVWRSYPHQLSGGQRQRVMIAMALALKPKLLVADEPTTALDVTVQAEIIKLVRDLQKEMGMAMLWITHDFGVVRELADSVVVMQHGKVVETGPARQVLEKPKAPYTKALLSATLAVNTKPLPRAKQGAVLLEGSGLSLTYREKALLPWKKGKELHALSGVNVQVIAGETVGVVGESGSGKSTLARVLTRLADAEPGARVVFLGQDFLAHKGEILRRARKDMQMVFQDPAAALNPKMTIGDAIAEGPAAHNLMPQNKLAGYVQKLLHDCGLPDDAAKRYPHQFSGGQRQRICIARALALQPKLLICDEAVSALDVSVQAQILDLLRAIQAKTGTAMLFISHDLRVISHLAHITLVMHQGKVVEAGETTAMFKKPAQAYTKRLLAAVV